jgi:hypothetical protein
MVNVFWDRKRVLMVEIMQQGAHNNVLSALRNTKKTPLALRTKDVEC